ncbi:Uncharacterised protein [Salmonella enterica subsp. salamae]|nr:Uncharacterised protein [Salmonella enterica subsp. salamae]
MKFDIILHLRKKAEKDINRAMREAESGMTWKQQSYSCVQAEH